MRLCSTSTRTTSIHPLSLDAKFIVHKCRNFVLRSRAPTDSHLYKETDEAVDEEPKLETLRVSDTSSGGSRHRETATGITLLKREEGAMAGSSKGAKLLRHHTDYLE